MKALGNTSEKHTGWRIRPSVSTKIRQLKCKVMYLKDRKKKKLTELCYQEGEPESSIQMYVDKSAVKTGKIHFSPAVNRSPSHGLLLYSLQNYTLGLLWSNIRHLKWNCFNSPKCLPNRNNAVEFSHAQQVPQVSRHRYQLQETIICIPFPFSTRKCHALWNLQEPIVAPWLCPSVTEKLPSS